MKKDIVQIIKKPLVTEKVARQAEKSAIVVEGEFDMISCYKHGIKNVVAVKGSAVTRDQLALLKRFTQHLILALDADFSGAETTKRAIQDAEELEFRIDIIRSNIGKDPDEALKKDAIAFIKAIASFLSASSGSLPILDRIMSILNSSSSAS
jgi:DNA primase